MKISLFTPTHNPTYLPEAYKFLKDQDYDEWVIVLNNGASLEGLSSEFLADARNKFIIYPGTTTKIGALKKFACSQCEGDILCELDHDDILVTGAIDLIRNAFISNPEASLVYGNCAEFTNDADRTPRTYALGNGWEYRDFYFDGVLYKEAVAPVPVPYHASIILWQPNHPRAFRKTCYAAAGGYNKNLGVLDDSDLMCRLYLQGNFIHIDKCLYLYRVTGDNTWLQRNKEIQDKMQPMQEANLWPLTVSWAKRNNLLMLDLGGRFERIEGALSVDLKDADIVCNLNDRWPFEESSIGVIRAFDIIEHLINPIHVMSEMHRVLIPGGYAFIEVPSTDGRGAFQDPLHVSFWNSNSFWYYTRKEQAKFIDNTSIRFKDITLKTYFPSSWHEEHNISYVKAHLLCLKDGYRPKGQILI